MDSDIVHDLEIFFYFHKKGHLDNDTEWKKL